MTVATSFTHEVLQIPVLPGITEGKRDWKAQLVIVVERIPGQRAVAVEQIAMCPFARGRYCSRRMEAPHR